MKKHILTLLSVIFVALSYAQSSGNTLRFYSDNSSYNHSVKASEIDSITYDYDYQLQKVYANEKILSFPLSEVDSVVFQDKLNYTVVNEIVDGMDGIFAEDGKVLLYGEDSEGNNVMQYGEFDFVTKTWKEESMFVIQVNDDGMPISFITKDLAYVLTYNFGDSFDVISFNENGTCEVIATNLSISNKSRAYGVRRAPSFGDVGGWVGNGLTVWNLISEIKAGGVALSTGLNALGALVGFGSATGGFLIGGTGDILALLKSGASGFYGGALTLATYLAQKSREFQLNHLGDWKISVISVQQKTRTQCEVTYSIAGINIDIEGNPRHRLLLRDPQNKYTTYDLGVAENGVFTKLIDISSPGDYSVEMSLYDECHKFIRQLTYPAAKFYMADLGIEKVEVQDYYYADEMVTYDLSIFLSGDKESLHDAKEYGYYIRYRDSYDYQFTEVNLSTIFASTESTKSLAIAKNLFEMDYSNLKAECTDYKVGAYVILKDGTLIFFDEQDIEFIYDEHPEVHTGEASSVSQTQATVKCEFEDCLFWNVLRGVEYFTDTDSESLMLGANEEDGSHEFPLEDLTPNTTYNYRAYYEVNGVREYGETKSFTTHNLSLSDISAEDSYYYDGKVYYDMTATIKSTKESLANYKECGVYYRNKKTGKAYKRATFSGNSETSEVSFSFYVNKEDFDVINHSSHYAKSSNFSFGVYVETQDGYHELYDEQDFDFEYDKEPQVTICNLVQGSTYMIDEGGWDRKTEYTYNISVDGGLFIDQIYDYYVGSWTTPGIHGYVSVIADADYNTSNAWVEFSSEKNPHTNYKYYVAIVNGVEKRSTNQIVYQFNGGSCSISLGGSNRSFAHSVKSSSTGGVLPICDFDINNAMQPLSRKSIKEDDFPINNR